MKMILCDVRASGKYALERLASVSGVSKSTLQRIEIGAISFAKEDRQEAV